LESLEEEDETIVIVQQKEKILTPAPLHFRKNRSKMKRGDYPWIDLLFYGGAMRGEKVPSGENFLR
jgi:hypothetical protein